VLIALASDWETGAVVSSDAAPEVERWLTARVLLPFAAALAVPATALCIWLAGSLGPWEAAYFAIFFAVILLLAFGRQAYLLVDNRHAIVRERTLSQEMSRRNQDLEALTGLASTMTQTLEETPIMERGLETMRLAARGTSAALHLGEGELTAVAGAWQDEHAWASAAGSRDHDGTHVFTRGARHVFVFPLSARDSKLGTVTLMRGAVDDFDDEEVERLELLANQLAIAIQNARDYREKLEQAIRDPLTGVYNRRFFFEALEKEVARRERYGSPVSLVIFDIDDFKKINDTFGHAVGDDALRKVTEIATGLIRPIDSFARLGGEEFGLLLPETQQLDALLVADRLRAAIARQEVIPDRRVTLSGGVASCPQDAMTSEELEQAADAALYWAKRNGKNICAVASEVTRDENGTGNEVEASLSHLYALVSTIDAEPLHTRDHSENVAAYAVALGQELGLSEKRVVKLRRAAFFHDIGKIGVSRSTLAKPGPLDDQQWEEIRIHPGVGSTMLVHAGLPEEARWVGQHHERMDGRGYPNGCGGDEIDLEARIIFVADAFEAMTSDRPYRMGMEVDEALAELRECSGTQFDGRVVDAMVSLLERDALTVLALRAA
jgi:diguanylate cyclase (GGDEF)-like protein